MTAISIIIATYNRISYLKDCIASLKALEYGGEYEIVIINDGSTDGTREYLDGLAGGNMRVIHNPENRGISLTRNAGIRAARYGIIAITDDDCLVSKDWLKELASGFKDDSVGFVIGETHYVAKGYAGYFPERLVSNIGARWPMSSNIAYRKEVLEKAGYFDDHFYYFNNEDSELAIRAVAAGFSFVRKREAVVIHQKMEWSPKSLLRSARNAAVWPVLKKRYSEHYAVFGPPVRFGLLVNAEDYLYFLTLPLLIPLLLARYLLHGKKDLKLFFLKWPVWLIMRRLYIYRESFRQRIFMI